MIRLLLLTMMFLTSVSSWAVVIDYRHEINDRVGNSHKDRLLLSHRFANGFGLSLEGMWKGSQNKDKALHETVSNGTEVVLSYVYKINPTWQVEPGFSLVSGSSTNNYRPYLRGRYTLSEDVNVSLRYRPYFLRSSGNIGTEKRTSENGYNLTGVFAWNFYKDYYVAYELDYKKSNSDGVVLANNKSYEVNHDVFFSYKFDRNWQPYIAIGNIPGSTLTNERQTRYRMGVMYTF